MAGGMGLVVLAVAVLPALGIGGLELIASEAPAPRLTGFRCAQTRRGGCGFCTGRPLRSLPWHCSLSVCPLMLLPRSQQRDWWFLASR